MSEQHEFKPGMPVRFKDDGLREFAGLTGRIIEIDNAPPPHTSARVEFDDPTAHYRHQYAPDGPVGEGVWAELRFLDALPTHDGKLSAFVSALGESCLAMRTLSVAQP